MIKKLFISIMLGFIGGFGAAATVAYFAPANTYVEDALLYLIVALIIGWLSMSAFVLRILMKENAAVKAKPITPPPAPPPGADDAQQSRPDPISSN